MVAETPGPGRILSRRGLIRVAPAAAAVLLATGSAPARARQTLRAGRTTQTPVTTPSPAPSASPLPPLDHPVYTLADYRRVVPGPAFPANAIALTIDDGPHPVWTPQILHLLDKYHVPALFCMIGNQVRGHESVARSVVAAGHQVANHTWSHPLTLAKVDSDRMRDEIHHAQDKIYSTTGHTPVLFRSPGGDWSATLAGATAQARMIPIDWSDDPRDWSRPGVPAITSRLMAARPGQILLCHDGGGDRSQTYTALQSVIPGLLARGFQFVALDPPAQ